MLPLALLAGAITATSSGELLARLQLEVEIADYELPGHPNTHGRGHLGTLIEPLLVWQANDWIRIEAGALVRLPLAIDFKEQIGASPILRLSAMAHSDPAVRLLFGSIDRSHGYHPALVDEARYRYARDYQEAYNRSLVPEAQRDLGGDPFMPVENGAQLDVDLGSFRATGFLDWQLLETKQHREKFAVGALFFGDVPPILLSAQLRLVHYGGELETRNDPLRFNGLDPVREILSLGATGELTAISTPIFSGGLVAGYFGGRAPQVAGGPSDWFAGGEIGVKAELFDRLLELGYRFWFPSRASGGFLSEDNEPVYRGGRSQRIRIGLRQAIGGVEIGARLDLVLPVDRQTVQYLTVTELRWAIEESLWSE